MSIHRWSVHMFGGSSLADAAFIHYVADIVEAELEGRLAVVLSACRGVTDQWLDLVAASERRGQPAVAASGVFGDVLRLAAHLGARL